MTEEYPIKSPRKLIEVALPLEAISFAAAREKSIRHGHPSTLHLWWSRKPLAAARAVIFAQLVNDPSWKWELTNSGEVPPNHLKASWSAKRKQLFEILTELVLWENTSNERVLERARVEIRRSWQETCEANADHPDAVTLFNPDKIPDLCDPFAGGGAIPLEAQRLGLSVFASDLNPVAVLMNKAMVQIPPVFSGRVPISLTRSPSELDLHREWPHATGIAVDLRYYGEQLRRVAEKKIGHLYVGYKVTQELLDKRPDLLEKAGSRLEIIAWLYCRTVRSPSPAVNGAHVPLLTKFWLCSRAGSEAYVEPVIKGDQFTFDVRTGAPSDSDAVKKGTQASRGSFFCILSQTPISYAYIDDEANAGRLGSRMIAVVGKTSKGRTYLPVTAAIEDLAASATPEWSPETPTRGTWASNAQGRKYGFNTFGDYFTNRQLVALGTFADSLQEVRNLILKDAICAGHKDDNATLESGGSGATAYADAVTTYLAFALSKVANIGSSLASWMSDRGAFRETFARQGIAMAWDFAEANPFSSAGGSLSTAIDKGAMVIDAFPARQSGVAVQEDAATQSISMNKIVCTDPPYYDNVGYADLSDFFYVWLRRGLRSVFPELFATLAVPKAEELVADKYRHKTKEKAEQFFLERMTLALQQLNLNSHAGYPTSIFYAFKQSETKNSQTSSSGWETFLSSLISSGFVITGTWPLRTEGAGRIVAIDNNSLASSILLVCRPRTKNAKSVSRREFIRELNRVLPEALDEMTRGVADEQSPVAPVDLSQAIIGPGMAVFSKYSAVLEADGSPMTVRAALQLINRFLAEDDFDKDTQFCLHWFDEYGWKEGAFGQADVLARAKATAVGTLTEAGVIKSGGGKVRLLKWSEYPSDWNPAKDSRTPVWESLHHLIRGLKQGGESAAGRILAGVQSQAEAVRQLAYRLYTLCERKGWAEDAGAYNELITSWSGIETATPRIEQRELF